jgi:Rps23 Pro-64 3,4-dihydroxylase Tpa1-like proline 4-hydroxylase
MTHFRLNPQLDVPALAREYRSARRLRVHDLLAEDGLVELYRDLSERQDWWHLINTPQGVLELDRAARAKMTARRRAALDRQVHSGARTGFQYRYEGLRMPAAVAKHDPADEPLSDFSRLMTSEPMLALLRDITGYGNLSFTDGHATAYGPGDFLTGHDDDVPGKNRLAAYVFGMTPQWRPEWGGLLLIHGPNDATVTGQVPRFNTLDLFEVPVTHSVSIVTPAAPVRRYAVTGWLRTGTR